ncbi:MAG: NnrS family protein [Mesorhizobium sp.]
MSRVRAWNGPALFSYGFRPFFLGAALWAAIAMALWLATLAGLLDLPTAFDPISWHAHEFLFGYLGAVAAGFLMTAVPNWTGRMPIVGWPLAGLFGLWCAGRVAVACSAWLPPVGTAAADLAFPLLLMSAMGREIVAGSNWRNLKVLAIMSMFILGNALFHWEAAQGGFAAEGLGLRVGLSAALMLIAVIGGRIVPSFTRNWLARLGPGRLPAPPEQGFDRAALAVLLLALGCWTLFPDDWWSGLALLLAVLLHLVRLARWAGDRTAGEPLVLVLHAAYAFLPLGALTAGAEIVWPGTFGATAALHPWMAGAIGLMTLAVMTRSTLGHTGRSLTAGRGTVAIYGAVLVAVFARMLAGLLPHHASALYLLSGLAWVLAFAGFAALYGGLLFRPRLRA